MKRLVIVSMIVTMLAAVGCSNKNTVTVSPSSSSNNTTTAAISNKEFTLEELKKYNGQNGNPAYVAVDGIVYDVTHAKDWRNGKHKEGATAGNDLTQAINQSPHGKEVLKDLPVVGKLK